MPSPQKITRLLAVDDDSLLSEWIGDPEHLIFQEARALVADWTGNTDAVEFCTTQHGEMFFANGSPVAYLKPPIFKRAA